MSLIQNILKALRSRVARNVYLWVILIYMVVELNMGNEAYYHYGIIRSPWYYVLIIAGFLLQMTMVYVNNLWLAPTYLSRRKYGRYFLLAGAMVFVVSLIYTFGLKYLMRYIDVNNLQQPGFVSSPVSKSWAFRAIMDDMQTYLFGNAMWVFIFTMAWYMNDYVRQQHLIEEAKKKQTETELNFLKSQVNPHFLFNTLNNLYGLALQKADNAPDAILRLSSILRYVLYESDVKQIAFEKEKETMQAYIDLEMLRITNTQYFSFNIKADRGDYIIPPLLWLPVLENLFKHGTRIIADNFHAAYNFVIVNSELTITCNNDYKAMPADNGNKQGGIGLHNLRKRLELLYPGRHNIQEIRQDHNYFIEVKVQL